ncbi:MAG: 50S ribosomal protein L15 [Planctomycetes bacterium]|nr:50S ribosomal protein L15 [Planctomycetota bacterium]
MNLQEVLSQVPARPSRKRRGRGNGSGLGGSGGRGQHGAKSRSGWRRRYGYEGGQMPLNRRIPKRGFNNFNFEQRFDVVNLGQLNESFQDGEAVDREAVKNKLGLKFRHEGLKILGDGELTRKLNVVAHKISKAARQKIEACGGSWKVLIADVVKKKPFKPYPKAPPEKSSEKGAEKRAGKGGEAEGVEKKGADPAAKAGPASKTDPASKTAGAAQDEGKKPAKEAPKKNPEKPESKDQTSGKK